MLVLTLLLLQLHSVLSPGAVNSITFELNDGVPSYRVERLGRPVIHSSALGFEIQGQRPLDRGFRVVTATSTGFDETWEQPWGEQRLIRNHYNELRVTLQETAARPRTLIVVFRAYDDGIAFRYEFPTQPNLGAFTITNEKTEFALTGDHTTWSIDGYQWNRFEYFFEERPVSVLDTVHTPITMKTADDLYMSFHEAALIDYSTMTLENIGGNRLKANLMPWADGTLVKTQAPSVTPWRTVQLSDTPGGLITSYLILNLNEPSKIEDTSWIEPGKYVGIWWEMHLDKATWGSGPKHGATTENAKRYIDFAAANGFDQVLVEGWNLGWEGDWYRDGAVFSFTEAYPDFDLEGVAAYAKEKGVKLMGHHETSATVLHYEAQMEAAFALYQRLGVTAVKMGYVGHGREIKWINDAGEVQREWHHGQYMVRHHQRVTELAAKYGITLNVHEGVKDTGLRRTWPNLMTREVAIGQEYNAWGSEKGNPPNHLLNVVFTRSLAGPFDYTPGVLDLYFNEWRPENRIKHTLAKELSLYITVYSPLQMAADLPENYPKYPQAFQFIKDVKADWDETLVLNGSIGEYVTIARKTRGEEEWFIGSMTAETGRDFQVPLHFLTPGATYTAQIYRDGNAADWRTAPYDFVVEEREVDSSTVLRMRLAPGGGQAVRLIRKL
jgi:alpha-glucosidase